LAWLGEDGASVCRCLANERPEVLLEQLVELTRGLVEDQQLLPVHTNRLVDGR
jgi:hypothetical protein